MYIKDLHTGLVRKYGTNRHDSLRIDENGRFLTYENLQDGDGSRYGDYRFVTSERGEIPKEDEDLVKHGADAYFNIGGFDQPRGTYQCFHCGAYSVVWQSDFSFEDYGMEGEGVINVCHCTNCGADIEYFVRMDEEEDTYIPYNNGSL